jgi:hypothetical protein
MSPRQTVLASLLLLGPGAIAHAQWPEPVDDSKVTVVQHEAVIYPHIARSARLQGAVVVGVSFDAQGTSRRPGRCRAGHC